MILLFIQSMLKKGFIFIIIILTVLTACSSSSNDLSSLNVNISESTSGYPITISHAFGETVLDKKPHRVATISRYNQDTPLALGVMPVGMSKATYGVTDGSGMLPWTKQAVEKIGGEAPVLFDDVDGLDFEAISDVQPDIILAMYSGITQEEYNTLSKIAPVIPYEETPWESSWREQLKVGSMALGLEEEGTKKENEVDEIMTTAVKKYPQVKGKKVAFGYFNPTDLSKVYLYSSSDPSSEYLQDLGMEIPQSIKDMQKDEYYFVVSAENAGQLNDIDVLITHGDPNTLLSTLQADPLLSTIPAVQRGSLVIIQDDTPLAAACTPTVLSIPATVDEYLEKISQAIKE